MLNHTHEHPFFSVVVPVHNGERFITQAIESVLRQTFPAWELVIVDDASTDNSAGIVSSYADKHANIILLKNKTNLKIRKSLNRGIETASGTWIVRLDADDFFSPSYLQTLYESALKHGPRCFISTWVTAVDENGRRITNIRLPEAGTIRRMMRAENFLYHPATSFPKTLWEEVGGYPPDSGVVAEDTAMWLRFFEAGVPLYLIKKHLVFYRLHYHNISAFKSAMIASGNTQKAQRVRENYEWRISLLLKQRKLSQARKETLALIHLEKKISAKNFFYWLLTFSPPALVYYFMWEIRPRIRGFTRKSLWAIRQNKRTNQPSRASGTPFKTIKSCLEKERS